jgi:flagellar hook-associated protein 1 FlgK
MPVSSFYGMQTSLRGLLAHQRMLDTTGHNIANASTQGYSRQEATLQASSAMRLTLTNNVNSVGAQLGSGVDVTGFRRVRDQFLDSQFRAQNTNLNEWSAKSEALDSAELSLAEPGENGINARLAKLWNAWSDLSRNPTSASAKQALVQTAGGLTDSIHSVRSQMVAAQDMAQGQYEAIVGDGGEIDKIASEIAGLNKTISQFLSVGEAPNDLLDRRDVLIDRLSTFGQVSVENLDGGSTNVSFVDRGTGTAYPVVSDHTAAWNGPPIGDWNPGGEMGGLLAVGKTPGGMIAGYLEQMDGIAQSLASAVNGIYGGEFFTVGTPAGATIKVADALQGDPNTVITGTGTGAASNDIALQISQLRGTPAVDGAYKAFVAKVGGDLNEAQRMQGNAQILADSVENRRQSVQGVSMDEEMSNLIRFQRAYQASARAMSTMDEMLDVLINRTGRVGL